MKALVTILVLSCFTWALYSCGTGKADSQTASNAAPSKDSLIKRGSYLVASIGCNDCHSPKKMGPNGPFVDTALTLSGFPANAPVPVATAEQLKQGMAVFSPDLTATAGPWGTTFAANITSDATGIGNWSLAQFKNAIRNGKYMGLKEERMIMPPMPWEDIRNLTDADIEAVFAYLKSTRPVHNVPPPFKPAGKN
jgi:mono/diheme cytochrome c family protein